MKTARGSLRLYGRNNKRTYRDKYVYYYAHNFLIKVGGSYGERETRAYNGVWGRAPGQEVAVNPKI